MVVDEERNVVPEESVLASKCIESGASSATDRTVVEEIDTDDDVLAIDAPYDPAVVPDQNDLLEVFINAWMSDWGTNVKNGKNRFKKHIEERNFDPMRAKPAGDDTVNLYRLAIMLDGKMANLPGRFLEEQGLCVEKGKNGNDNKRTKRWQNLIDFAYDRLNIIRRQVGKPEPVETSQGPLFQSSFTKPGLIAQYKQMTADGIKRLEDLDGETIAELDIEKGKKLLTEIDQLLTWMNEEIIPTSTENMKKSIHEMALLKIRVSDEKQNELEFFDDNGEFVVIKGPRLKNKSSKEKKKSLERWLHKYLLPLFNKWTSKLIKKLPEGMTALSTFVGVDMENHAVQEKHRGRCLVCQVPGKHHSKEHLSVMQKIHLIHFRYGVGTLFVSLEGLGIEGMFGANPGEVIIPKGAACVPMTDCEIEEAGGYRCALDVIFNLFFNEQTTATVPCAFNAKGAERKSLKEIQETVFKKRAIRGYRVGETSVMTAGSLPNLAMQDSLYEDADGAREVRSASGIQCTLIHERRMTGSLYKNAQLQGNLTLRNIGRDPDDVRNKEELLYVLYNKEDSTLCQNAMILAVVAIVLQSPLLVATGSTKFLKELCEMLPELVARSSVKDKLPWMTEVKMPPMNRMITETLNIANLPGMLQIHKYKTGCFAEFGIPPGTIFRETEVSNKQVSEPDIYEGKKNKKDTSGLIIQDNQAVWGEPGVVVQIGEVNMMQSLGEFEMSEGNGVMENNTTQKRGSEAREISGDASRRAEEPRPKKQVVSQTDEGMLVENKFENLEKAGQLLPNAKDIVEVLKNKNFLTADEVEELSKKVQDKVDAATEEKMMIADRKNEVAVKNQQDIATKTREVERLKEDAVTNNKSIQKLLEEQSRLRESIKASNIELMAMKKREADRKKEEVESMAAEQEEISEKAVIGGSMIIAEIQSKNLEKFGKANYQPIATSLEVVEEASEHFAPLSERSFANHIPEEAPLEMRRWGEDFITYAHWRWSYLELVKVIMAILDKMKDVIKEFEGIEPKEADENTPAVEGTGKHSKRFQHGSFQGVAQLSKQIAKVSQVGKVNYHAARKLVSIFKTLVKIHVDDTEIEDYKEIDPSKTPAEQCKMKQTNANNECKKYLKQITVKIDEACREVTGEGLVMPWACQGDLEISCEKIFTDVAKDIAIQKTKDGPKVWQEADGKRYLEVKITAVVQPMKPFIRANSVENLDEELGINDRYTNEGESSQAKSTEWVERNPGERILRYVP